WTDDRYQAQRIARELRAGMVWLNDHLPSPTVSRGPWGAAARGGLGRTLGEAGLRACAQEKLITWDPPAMRGLWWGPYDELSARGARACSAGVAPALPFCPCPPRPTPARSACASCAGGSATRAVYRGCSRRPCTSPACASAAAAASWLAAGISGWRRSTGCWP